MISLRQQTQAQNQRLGSGMRYLRNPRTLA